jgi:hypothetical protein
MYIIAHGTITSACSEKLEAACGWGAIMTRHLLHVLAKRTLLTNGEIRGRANDSVFT